MTDEKKNMIQRLNRIEGQVRGVKRMIETDEDCPNVLIQVSAVTAALNSFGKLLLSNHLKTQVADDLRNGKTDSVDGLIVTLNRMLK